MNPIIDPSVYSDDELQEKIFELQKKLYMASVYMSQGSGVIENIQSLLDMFTEEYRNRRMLEMMKQWDAQFPDVIHTDPEFAEPKDKATKVAASKKSSVKASGDRPVFNKTFRNK